MIVIVIVAKCRTKLSQTGGKVGKAPARIVLLIVRKLGFCLRTTKGILAAKRVVAALFRGNAYANNSGKKKKNRKKCRTGLNFLH